MRNSSKPHWHLARESLGLSCNEESRKLNRFMICGTMQERSIIITPSLELLCWSRMPVLFKFYQLQVSILQGFSVWVLNGFSQGCLINEDWFIGQPKPKYNTQLCNLLVDDHGSMILFLYNVLQKWITHLHAGQISTCWMNFAGHTVYTKSSHSHMLLCPQRIPGMQIKPPLTHKSHISL